MPVDTKHKDYLAMVSEWEKITHCCACEKVVHAQGEVYLSRLSGMSDDAYDAYKARAAFVMFTKRTIEAFVGMVMRKQVEINGFESTNIDGKGNDLNHYVGSLLKHFLMYGRCGTLVDLPEVTEVITVADEINKNVFPRLLFYGVNDVINWRTSVINNIEVLSMVVLREKIAKPNTDEFDTEEEYQYRVLDLVDGLYRQRLFDKDSNVVTEVYPKHNSEPLQFIPFKIHGGIAIDYPPLLSVADQNLHHYQQDADYKHGLHYVALPTPWVTGMSKDDPNSPRSIGPTTLWFLDEGCTCGMLEFTGAGLMQIAKAMETTVETIVILASRILAPEKSSNDESALAAAIRSNAETSSLAGIVSALSKEITEMIRIVSWWSNKDPEKVKININSDFMPAVLTGSDMLSYVTAWIKGAISYETLFDTLKSGDVVAGDRIIDDEIKAISEEQKKRLVDEVAKTEKMKKAEGETEEEEDPDLPKAEDAEPKLDRRIS